MDAVSVSGGLGKQLRSMRAMAAVQLPWQSSSVLSTPPFRMPAGQKHMAHDSCMNTTHVLTTSPHQWPGKVCVFVCAKVHMHRLKTRCLLAPLPGAKARACVQHASICCHASMHASSAAAAGCVAAAAAATVHTTLWTWTQSPSSVRPTWECTVLCWQGDVCLQPILYPLAGKVQAIRVLGACRSGNSSNLPAQRQRRRNNPPRLLRRPRCAAAAAALDACSGTAAAVVF